MPIPLIGGLLWTLTPQLPFIIAFLTALIGSIFFIVRELLNLTKKHIP